MANTTSQAEAIRDLLVERLELYDASLDVSEGSALWTQVVEPVFEALGTDPFDTDIRSFLKDRVTQSFPNLSAQDGDGLVDLLITPLEVLVEPLKRELQIVRQGQSARKPELLRLEDARDLAANFFVDWNSGSRASGIVRVYFPAPTYVTILPTVEFTTAEGLKFYPTTPITVRPEQMLLYRSGTEYYVDVPATSAEAGKAYKIEKGTITSVKGISGYSRVANLSGFEGGDDPETVDELLARTRASLTERTLNVRRGIVARIESDFKSVTDVEVVGYGDPEMNRDIVTGGGEGSVVASGICIVVGQFVLMFCTFEDRGVLGTTSVSEGDEIELNFWSFLYDTATGAANEKFTVGTILFDSRSAIPQMPSVLLFRISSVPSVTKPIAGTLPGVLPGVFAVVRGAGKIEISDIPGGILNPDTARGTIEINDGEVHIGGHYDVWLRTSSATADSATFSDARSQSALLEGTDLVVGGDGTGPRHLVHRTYQVTSTTSFALGATLAVSASGAYGTIYDVSADGSSRTYSLWEMGGIEFEVGDSVSDGTTTGTVSGVTSTSWEDGGAEAGMVLSLPRGNEEGSYRILKVDGPFLYLDIELTTTANDQLFRVLREVSVDLFDPRTVLVPFGEALGDDLRTTIGSALLRTSVNLQDYGAAVGDIVEILSGDDQGTYAIQSWSSDYGGTGPVVESSMTATNSSVEYTVYRTTQAVQRPLLRMVPGGVVLLDSSGQDSGYTVPYAQPVDARTQGAFSGSRAVAAGRNGFVLMDPGSGWAPTGDYAVDIGTFDWSTWTGGDFEDFYDDEKFKRCYTDECVTGSGYIAVISVYGSDGQMYLDSTLPASAQNFLASMRDWFLSVISTFNFGGDEEALVESFHPLKFGPNEDTSQPLLLQFEILIPFEVFDGCNNVFVALPEFDWESEFESSDTFEEAVGRFNDGELRGRVPALLRASAGDVLTVLSGQNAGAYVVDSVQQYYLINGGALVEGGGSVDLTRAYQVALVVIRDEFPVPALQGLPEFFEDGTATWSLLAVPSLPFTVTDSDGDEVSGWGWVETTLTWLFQLFTSMGFDLPEDVSLDVPETLKVFWQLLFNDYVVGRPTAPQYVRMYFQEPTSCTVYAPQPCARYTWALPDPQPSTLIGEVFTLPLADLEGVTATIEVEDLSGSHVLTGALPAAAGSAATVEDLAAVLQELLDPDSTYVVFSGPATATGALTITTVGGGVDEFTYVSASDATDAFFWFGFYETDPGRYVVVPPTSGTASSLYEDKTITVLGYAIGLSVPTTLVRVVIAAPSGNFTLGETVTGGTSGATGVVYAWFRDTGAVRDNFLYLYDVSGTFVAIETVTGDDSSTTGTTGVVTPNYEIDPYVPITVSGPRTYAEVAANLATQIYSRIIYDMTASSPGDYEVSTISTGLAVTCVYEDDVGDLSGNWRFVITVDDPDYPDLFDEFSVDVPSAGTDFSTPYISADLPISSASHELTGTVYTVPVDIADVSVTVTLPDSTTVEVLTELTYPDAVALDAVVDQINDEDYEGAAQALNARADFCREEDGEVRRLLWFDSGTGLAFRALAGGPSSSAEIPADTGLVALLFAADTYEGTSPDTNAVSQGETEPGETVVSHTHPRAPTIFVTAAGAAELLYAPSSEADDFQVFPGQTEDGDPDVTDLPRDVVFSTPYDGQLSAEVAFTDTSYAAPIELDFREEDDWLVVYEQRTLLAFTTYEATDTDTSSDRVVAVFTEFGSNVVEIPDFSPDGTNEFTFLAPNSGEDGDQVQVGDVVFVEEGDDTGGYTVVERTATTLTLDRSLTSSTERTYRHGNDGVLVPDSSDAKVASASASFSSTDVGRYLTLWACNRDEEDGSYRITAVEADGSGCTLDTDPFPESEVGVHWVVAKAPTEEPGDSEIGGRTALVGLRPIRVYSGDESRFRVVRVGPELDRTSSRVFVALDEDGTPPKSGVKQPYKVVRPGAQHVSSTAMSAQLERGLFYFDVLAQSLGADDVYNVPHDTKLEPVFGTYDSDGYRVDVADNRYTFSTQEEATMVMSPTFLPVGLDDQPSNRVILDARGFRIDYEYAPVVAQVQSVLSSDADRVLCANALARHFLPAYVYFDVSYSGGNSAATIAQALVDYVDGLSAVDALDVSKLEKVLHQNGVTRYDHPVRVITLTHDLDRRIVGTQSDNLVDDDAIAYNGTNRTTFFIAGPDQSSVEDEADVPVGERTRLVRSTVKSTFR